MEFKKKQAEEAKKIKEMTEKAKKGPLGTKGYFGDQFCIGGGGIKKSK